MYLRIVIAYRQPKPEMRKSALSLLTEWIGIKAPEGLPKLKWLGTTIKRRKADVLVYLDHVAQKLMALDNGGVKRSFGAFAGGNELGFRNLVY